MYPFRTTALQFRIFVLRHPSEVPFNEQVCIVPDLAKELPDDVRVIADVAVKIDAQRHRISRRASTTLNCSSEDICGKSGSASVLVSARHATGQSSMRRTCRFR